MTQEQSQRQEIRIHPRAELSEHKKVLELVKKHLPLNTHGSLGIAARKTDVSPSELLFCVQHKALIGRDGALEAEQSWQVYLLGGVPLAVYIWFTYLAGSNWYLYRHHLSLGSLFTLIVFAGTALAGALSVWHYFFRPHAWAKNVVAASKA